MNNTEHKYDWIRHNVKPAQLSEAQKEHIRREIVANINKPTIDWRAIANDSAKTQQLIDYIWPPNAISGGSHSDEQREIASVAPSATINTDRIHEQINDTSAAESENDNLLDSSAILRLRHLHPEEEKKCILSTDYGCKGFRAFALQAKDTRFRPLPSIYDDPRTTREAQGR